MASRMKDNPYGNLHFFLARGEYFFAFDEEGEYLFLTTRTVFVENIHPVVLWQCDNIGFSNQNNYIWYTIRPLNVVFQKAATFVSTDSRRLGLL